MEARVHVLFPPWKGHWLPDVSVLKMTPLLLRFKKTTDNTSINVVNLNRVWWQNVTILIRVRGDIYVNVAQCAGIKATNAFQNKRKSAKT